MLKFTEKAESDGVGKAGADATPKDETELRYWKTHGYVSETSEVAALDSPPVDGAVRRGKTSR